MRIQRLLFALFFLLGILIFPSCSANHEDETELETVENATEPVTLIFAASMNWLGPDEFKMYIENPVQKRYPHISFETIDINDPDNSWDELFAAGIIPDIVMSATPIIFRYTDYDLEYDIEPLIKDHNFDLSQLDPVAVESVKTASQSDVLTGLPWTMHINGLYYNTDIFDQLGLDYPHDGMTWTELRELATHLSRSDAGIQFRGLEPDKTSEIGSILGLSLIDAETMTATIDNDGWRYVFELLESIYSIPGNDHPAFAAAAWDQFVQEQNLAMLTPFANNLPLLQEVEGLNWDIAQYPSFDEYPNLATQVDAWVLHITKHSKHKNEAFQAIATVLSEDVQSELAKNGRVPVLTDDSVQEVFGQNLSYLEGKNLEALFKSQQAKALPVTRYDGTAQGIISNAIIRVVQDGIDINTALREAEEELNGVIQDGEAGN